MKKLHTIFMNEKNRHDFISVLMFIVIVLLIYYFFPYLFMLSFQSIFGILMLVIIILFIMLKNMKVGIILLTIFLAITFYMYISNKPDKEGFVWDNKTQKDFLKVEHTLNRNKIFSLDRIQEQASKEEVDYLIANNMWPWKNEVENLYEASVGENSIVQTYSKDSLANAKKLYNQQAILDILSGETKESKFLTDGVFVNTGKDMLPDGTGTFGYNAGLTTNLSNLLIKCYPDNPDSENYVLKKREYIGGDGGITGINKYSLKNVDVNNLENIVPGFTFLKGPCNPCVALNTDKNNKYSCPFELNIKNNENGVSAVWKYLWSLEKYPITDADLKSKKDLNVEVAANNFTLPPFAR